MSFRVLLKLAFLPFRRSWFVLTLVALAFAQVMLALWFCGGLQNEIQRSLEYSERARFMSIQMKDELSPIDAIQEVLKGQGVSYEELSTEEVLRRMEVNEPDIVQTVRVTGSEGLQLMPRLLIVRGVFTDASIERIQSLKEVYRVDVSPIHHQQLGSFYRHLGVELKIVIALILFLILVQLLVFERLQRRDSHESCRNLLAWGATPTLARLAGFLSVLCLSAIAFFVSCLEWMAFQKWIWNGNAFLGELSLDQSLHLPLGLMVLTFFGVMGGAIVLALSSRPSESGL